MGGRDENNRLKLFICFWDLPVMSGWSLPRRFPFIYSRSSIKISPRRKKVMSGTMVVMNTLIFDFLSLAIGKASLVFGGIVCANIIYALGRRITLRNIHEEVKCDRDWCEKISIAEAAS